MMGIEIVYSVNKSDLITLKPLMLLYKAYDVNIRSGLTIKKNLLRFYTAGYIETPVISSVIILLPQAIDSIGFNLSQGI